ncbi:hypothetical protein [Psychrobacillus sp. FSL K6-1464]|uniref:hypothetical protein n=1 Tax=Psychrobacillus sp. FSL K6-1464 TaxID=2921545 RepID=UPI0030F8A780
MITVKELFDGAVEYDMKFVAHAIFWALSEKIIGLEDDANKLQEIVLNQEAIQKLTDQNILGIERIKLFVITTNNPSLFAFYFAEDILAASGLHQNLFGEQGTKITKSTRLMSKYMHFATPNLSTNFFEYRKRFVQYPAYIGHAVAGENVCYQLSRNEAAG